MLCKKCKNNFPYEYYFAAAAICKNCFQNLNAEEKKFLLQQNEPVKPVRKKLRLITFLKMPISIILAFLFLAGIVMIITFAVLMVNPATEAFDTFKDFGLLFELESADHFAQLQAAPTPSLVSIENLKLLFSFKFSFQNRFIIFLYFLTKIFILIFTIVIFIQLKKILTSREAGNPFTRKNSSRIRRTGFSIIGINLTLVFVGLGSYFTCRIFLTFLQWELNPTDCQF